MRKDVDNPYNFATPSTILMVQKDSLQSFFDLDAYNRFNMSKEEIELADANKDEKEKKEEAKKKADEKQKKTGKIEVEKVKPLELDIENCHCGSDGNRRSKC